jgi:glucose-6-phosphate 1-dehydrogenase
VAFVGERQTLLILGASGDLTTRLLLPGLASVLASEAGADMDLLLLGAGLHSRDDDEWRQHLADVFAGTAPSARTRAVSRNARFITADVTSVADLRRLLDACDGPPVIFFALPPAVTMRACRQLCQLTPLPAGTRLALEKPFGTDLTSAAALNELLAQLVPERGVYRIDHFLGKSTVLNLLGLRFANRMLEPVLTAEHVAAIEIVYDEDLALENRAGYYDRAGALVDMIQSHLLQVLSLLVMPAPTSLDPEELSEKQTAALQATRAWADNGPGWIRRARYTAGQLDGRRLPAYVDEPGVDPDRNTETFAELVVTVDTPRWAGVPIRLRSGKALARARKEVAVVFKHAEVPAGLRGYQRPDRLRIAFEPDRLHLDMNINGPADPFTIDPITLSADFAPGTLSAYGEIIAGLLAGDPTLAVRAEAAEQCWRIVEPALAAFRTDEIPLQEYPAGSSNP